MPRPLKPRKLNRRTGNVISTMVSDDFWRHLDGWCRLHGVRISEVLRETVATRIGYAYPTDDTVGMTQRERYEIRMSRKPVDASPGLDR